MVYVNTNYCIYHQSGFIARTLTDSVELPKIAVAQLTKNWFKRLQNIFKTYLNPSSWFSKHFQVNVYIQCLKDVL